MSFKISIAISSLIVVTTIVLTDPFMLYMPMGIVLPMLIIACVSLCAWAGLVMTETSTDEREQQHRDFSGRLAYVSGLLMLTAAFVFQGYHHAIDPVIPYVLSAMVITKIGARMYAETRL
jgi:hypothetical protein